MFNEMIRLLRDSKTKSFLIFLISFLTYVILDRFSSPFYITIKAYGVVYFISMIIVNVVMSIILTLIMLVQFQSIDYGGKFSPIATLSSIISMITSVCVPCVIAIITTLGATSSSLILSSGGMLFKLISVVIMTISLIIVYRNLYYKSCDIK